MTRRNATHRILCLSLFLCLRFYSLNRQRNWPKTATKRKQNKISFYLHTYIYLYTYNTIQERISCACVCADNNSCLLSVLVFCFYFETRFLALCPFLGMVLSIYVHIRVHFLLLLLLMYFATSTLDLAVVNTLIRMQSQKR